MTFHFSFAFLSKRCWVALMLSTFFPALLPHPENIAWSHTCITAHTLISECYARAVRTLNQEDGDPVYMQTLLDTL